MSRTIFRGTASATKEKQIRGRIYYETRPCNYLGSEKNHRVPCQYNNAAETSKDRRVAPEETLLTGKNRERDISSRSSAFVPRTQLRKVLFPVQVASTRGG